MSSCQPAWAAAVVSNRMSKGSLRQDAAAAALLWTAISSFFLMEIFLFFSFLEEEDDDDDDTRSESVGHNPERRSLGQRSDVYKTTYLAASDRWISLEKMAIKLGASTYNLQLVITF